MTKRSSSVGQGKKGDGGAHWRQATAMAAHARHGGRFRELHNENAQYFYPSLLRWHCLGGVGARGRCMQWRRGDCKSVGARRPCFCSARTPKPKTQTANYRSLFCARHPGYCLFVVLRDSRESRQEPPAMHNESMTPLRSRDRRTARVARGVSAQLYVCLPDARTRTDADGHATAQPYAKRFARRYQRVTIVIGAYSGNQRQPASMQLKIAHNCHHIKGV